MGIRNLVIGGRVRLAATAVASVATAVAAFGAAMPAQALTPGAVAFVATGTLPTFPCGGCSASLGGDAEGVVGTNVIGGLNNLSVTVSSYFETGCPALTGNASGTFSAGALVGAAAGGSFTYSRVGLVATLTVAGTPDSGNGVAIFVPTSAGSGLTPGCPPGPLSIAVIGALVII